MTKKLLRKPLQTDFVQSAVRFPPELRDRLKSLAEVNGRSFNAEVIARLQESVDDKIIAEIEQVKSMIQQLIDRD